MLLLENQFVGEKKFILYFLERENEKLSLN